MPYIKQEDRAKMDEVVGTMCAKGVIPDGKLNYVLYKFCKDMVRPSYAGYKNYCAELRQCATEIERRLLGPYEDIKRDENGEV